jgi:hypothetical protein
MAVIVVLLLDQANSIGEGALSLPLHARSRCANTGLTITRTGCG